MKKATITEKELRKAWSEQGLPKVQQDAKLAKALGPYDVTPAGVQSVLRCGERASDGAIVQRRADAPLKPKANQRACDAGLFSDVRDQGTLF